MPYLFCCPSWNNRQGVPFERHHGRCFAAGYRLLQVTLATDSLDWRSRLESYWILKDDSNMFVGRVLCEVRLKLMRLSSLARIPPTENTAGSYTHRVIILSSSLGGSPVKTTLFSSPRNMQASSRRPKSGWNNPLTVPWLPFRITVKPSGPPIIVAINVTRIDLAVSSSHCLHANSRAWSLHARWLTGQKLLPVKVRQWDLPIWTKRFINMCLNELDIVLDRCCP